ncbi:MAG: hypothetical protein ABEI74_02105 [Candidatus Pacearchaeota archaeon]
MASLKEPLISGLISVVIGTGITYLVSLVIQTSELKWALIAVAIASFFSGFFSRLNAR